MTLQEAIAFLKGSTRYELRDHAFGDMEVYWSIDDKELASGYFGSTSTVSLINDTSFSGDQAIELLKCGNLVVERNDETGPEEFTQGEVMKRLRIEDVLIEICTPSSSTQDC